MSDPFRLIHISDLHFSCLPRTAAQWFSKRGIGAANFFLMRKKDYPLHRARLLVTTLQAMEWDHLVITGDLTQLSLEEEFELAHETLAPLLQGGAERVTILPGNHDRYVADPESWAAYRARFGRFFGDSDIVTRRLTDIWWLVGWDSTRATPPLNATGEVRRETFEATEAWMATLPANARVVVANHYPVASPKNFSSPHLHELINREDVFRWLRRKHVDLYLHGHVHTNWIITVENGDHPLRLVNSASTTRNPRPDDPSSFHRIELSGEFATIYPQHFD
ncbi:MAG: metallophosphoesterase [SAR324 cluster bacterium]|nr:metallophosphoesterase [SAR324 cluster bacterium]